MRLDIAQHLIGHADVFGNDLEYFRHDLACAVEFHRRQGQTFLENAVGVSGVTAPADIGLVCDVDGKSNDFSLVKYRHGERNVVQMTGGEPRVIGDRHVIWVPVRPARYEMFGHRRAAASEPRQRLERLRQQIAIWGEQHAGVIVGFAHDVGKRGADDNGRLLFGDRD